MSPDAVRREHVAARLNEAPVSRQMEKSCSEKEKYVKYGACELRDDQLARKAAANCRELEQAHQRIQTEGLPEGSQSGSEGDSASEKTKLSPLERLAQIVPGLGIMLALLSSLFLGTAGMLVKLTTSVHGIQVAVLRNLIQLLVYSLIIGLRGLGVTPACKELLPVAMRAILGGMSITLSYCALKLIPLGDATTIRFSLPIWTLIMGYFFLRESCSPFKVCAVVICVAGVVLIARPDECLYLMHIVAYGLRIDSEAEFLSHKQSYEQSRVQEMAHLLPADAGLSVYATPNNSRPAGAGVLVRRQPQDSSIVELLQDEQVPPEANERDESLQVASGFSYDPLLQFEGCMTALAGSICLSVSLISLRLCKKTPAEIIIFWLSASSVLTGTIMLLAINKWSLPDNPRDLCYVLLNGLCGSIGQWFMTSSLKVEQSGIIALARTFDIEIAFLYSALLLDEQIRTTSIVGSICVMSGVVIVVIPRLLARSSQAADERAASPAHSPAGADTRAPQLGALSAATIIDRSSYERHFGATLRRQQSDHSEHPTISTTISRLA